ncbi:DUF3696 domain-containing protein [Pseudomonas aeruginosa]|uniref:DUF3696 domain-containing protein n=1 Tax=Pseudomonas aeruginosa TaxID=287 RepID=UPI001D4DDF4F|nr:DUF3696 domain-containing protein [Pseudomonas aeruginosa]MBX5510923.1 DUF3696 domain-containing protein [Pseudomonas aeruginosa]MBX5535348.1 DUF3696 domain-containing protein [Pseudomonas aeruginosa]
MKRILHIHNFKAFKDQKIEIRPLTLLSGLNGTGKSTTLQAIALLRQSMDANGFSNIHGLLLNGELIELGTGADVLHNEHSDSTISFTVNSEESDNYYIYEANYANTSDVLPRKKGFIKGDPIPGLYEPGFQYLKADRISPAVNYPKSHHTISVRKFLGTRGEYSAHFLNHYRDQKVNEKIRLHPSTENKHALLTQVNAWLQEVSPGASVNIEEVPRTDFMRLEYAYGSTAGIRGGDPFRATNVGFGLTYSLPVIVACLALEKGSLLLIENPEAHLHPKGQVAIGELIARAAAAGIQVIIETHSDHVLNGIRIAVKEGLIPNTSVGLNFFSRTDVASQPQNLQPEISPTGRLSEWPEGFFDQWDRSLDRILD